MILLKQTLVAALLCVAFIAPEGFATETAELAEIQKRVVSVAEKCVQATVALRVGGAGGSGVIVTKDGLSVTK